MLDEIRKWLVGLSQHVAKGHDGGDLAAMIERTAVMLAAKAPADLFTGDSLEFCLRRFKFFPTYADLWARLQTFQREQLKQHAIAGPSADSTSFPGADDMPAADRAMVGFWSEYQSGAKKFPSNVTRATWLSMIRRPAPAAFQYIMSTDDTARAIALDKGWIREPEEIANETREVVHEQVREVRASTVDDAPRPAAPTPAATPSPPEGVGERFEAQHGRKIGALTSAQLDELRKASGIRVPASRPAGSRVYTPPRPANDATPPPPDNGGGPFPWSSGGSS